MKKINCLIASLLISANVHSAVNGVSHHSRANCGNNESISWDGTKAHWFWVNSNHVDGRTGRMICIMTSNWLNTRRAAMVHWGEGTYGWIVYGEHWMFDQNNTPYKAQWEMTKNCDIYNGWWEMK